MRLPSEQVEYRQVGRYRTWLCRLALKLALNLVLKLALNEDAARLPGLSENPPQARSARRRGRARVRL